VEWLKTYTKEEVYSHVQARASEQKIGQTIQLISNESNLEEALSESTAQFVLVGIPEDIGIRANYGRPGASQAWPAFLQAFLNLQDNLYLEGSELLLLGHIEVSDLMEKAMALNTNIETLRELTEDLDNRVLPVIQTIVNTGKIPLIVGGGHNNAYGAIGGTAKALNRSINCLNIDAHTDLRRAEGRHSGNAFTYAIEQELLAKYYVYGLQESYTPHHIFEFILANQSSIGFSRFEAILQHDPYMLEALDEACEYLKDETCGLEIDLDVIAMMPSSAMAPDGFLLREVRQMIRHCSQQLDFSYLHVCEGSPPLLNALNVQAGSRIVGRAIANIVADFIKWNRLDEQDG